jgi:hypothetical protein
LDLEIVGLMKMAWTAIFVGTALALLIVRVIAQEAGHGMSLNAREILKATIPIIREISTKNRRPALMVNSNLPLTW